MLLFRFFLEDYFPHLNIFYYSFQMHNTFIFCCQSLVYASEIFSLHFSFVFFSSSINEGSLWHDQVIYKLDFKVQFRVFKLHFSFWLRLPKGKNSKTSRDMPKLAIYPFSHPLWSMVSNMFFKAVILDHFQA